MTQALEQRTYTHEEYLEFEMASEERHEFVNGEIRLITGGTPDHNELRINLATLLKSALRGKPCRILGDDQRLWIPDRNPDTYPDLNGCRKTFTVSNRAYRHRDQSLLHCKSTIQVNPRL